MGSENGEANYEDSTPSSISIIDLCTLSVTGFCIVQAKLQQ
jgi:hypothetical protein